MRRSITFALSAALAAACTRTEYVTRSSPSPSPVVVYVTPSSAPTSLADHQPPRGDWWCFLNTGTQALSCGNSRLFLADIPLGEGGVLFAMDSCSYQDVERFEAGLPGEGFVTIWDCFGSVEEVGWAGHTRHAFNA